MTTSLKELADWVEATGRLTKPDRIHWCIGDDAEKKSLIELLRGEGTLSPLAEDRYPGCYLSRSHPNDVARVEHLTYVCTTSKEDAGPNNNWMDPTDAHRKIDAYFEGSMRGRTMYVIPYCMGPLDSPLARCGVEITDSAYVVLNMLIMTRAGSAALRRIERDRAFVRGLHSIGDLSPERRLIMHFPESLTIKSFGSGYGGNALLGKKCHALRIASWQARREGWLAEHMLILGLESPEGKTSYVAAAFPSACGKTNLAMLIPPKAMPGWKVWTVGDDIAWMHLGTDGRLWAINPEAGFFGVVPGTSEKTNPNALAGIQRNTIFTNVAVTRDRHPWWEGLTKSPPADLLDWQGRPYDPARGPAAHPNSRFTVSAKQCPTYSPKMEDPQGVPISAIIFGGRRAELAPLVVQSKNWVHGVLLGASLASETTAAAQGQAVGVVRRDPMAMRPFCGYNFGDYWKHWLSFGEKSDHLPRIFHVNWFRQDASGRFLWPGFGENLRVLDWILRRSQEGTAAKTEAVQTPLGFMPSPGSIDRRGLDVSDDDFAKLFAYSPEAWTKEFAETREYFEGFGSRFPEELWTEHRAVIQDLM